MAEHVPHIIKSPPITMTCATAAITGGQLVEMVGNMTCQPAGAGSAKAIGVAARDAIVGAQVPVYTDGVHDLTAAGAIASGDQLIAGAAGTVATVAAVTTPTAGDVNATRQLVGKALEAIADTAKGRVLLGVQ